MTTSSTRPTVVVGVDGSEGSRAALHWAVNFARQAGATVTAVTAWHFVPQPVAPGLSPMLMTMTESSEEEAAVRAARLVLADLPSQNDVPIEHIVVQGSAKGALLDASHGALALVVGTRGHGAIAGALLGSVSQACATHAGCPVVVVPTPQPTKAQPATSPAHASA